MMAVLAMSPLLLMFVVIVAIWIWRAAAERLRDAQMMRDKARTENIALLRAIDEWGVEFMTTERIVEVMRRHGDIVADGNGNHWWWDGIYRAWRLCNGPPAVKLPRPAPRPADKPLEDRRGPFR